MPHPQRRQAQELQLLQPQELPVDVPATEPELPQRRQPQPHEELEQLPLLVPPTEPEEVLLLQVQVHVQRLEVLESLVPPTEPEFWQQGLQQELATKLGNTMPP